jgi:SAM-dependent methyltransferase
MDIMRRLLPMLCIALVCGSLGLAQQGTKPFEPVSGQAGKDVVWVPTPEATVEKMLDVARVTPQDFVMDLGSGDGRNVIGAAKRGVRGVGVEWEQNMVDLSKRRAAEAGVAETAQFIQGDMYEADISNASVMLLFLLPHNMTMLLPKFLALKPGSRIVSNTFSFGDEGWEPDQTESVENCVTWCQVLLWIVPAEVSGSWQLPQGMLTLTQKFQKVSGTLGNAAVADGKLRGDEITFAVGNARYTGRVNGNVMEGTVSTGDSHEEWRAVRASTTPRE